MLQRAAADQGAARRPLVFVISDVLLYRDGIASGLSNTTGIDVLGTAGSADALARLAELHPDAVLIDVAATDALALARAMKVCRPGLPLVGFGITSEESSLACAEAGLTGFVGRDGTLAELADTIRQALSGQVGCSPQLAAMLCQRLASLSGARPAPPSLLTTRERQIAALVSDGLSNKEIAQALRIGPATVKNHVHNILDKLHVPRRSAIPGRMSA
ncbi:response regulator transcription factor [Sandarakinorhabdus sp.]|uniref:response regulator transcription factor n=1 Tax=Sandarakinorhabdus sp. TaxID=1916663 RepID=UPI00286DF6BD|nr:response regulator transcription factor [Sandarakinorhabdus sp.]